jgi:SAGA-associated factor 29
MAARSRPRGGQIKDDFDEERNIWNSIRRDAQKVDEMLVFAPVS